MSFCPKCGNELTDADEFCSKCGHHNEEHLQVKPETQPATSVAATATGVATPRKKLSGCAIAAIVVGSLMALIGIVVVIVMVAAFSMTGPAVDAIEAHLAALKNGEVDLAYEDTSSDFKRATSLEAYRSYVNSYPILKDVAETSFSDRLIENGMATLKGTITDSQGDVTAFNALLRKEGEEWKVQGLELPNVPPITSNAPPVSESTRTPIVDAINAHLAALKEGKEELAYGDTSTGFKKATSLEAYRNYVDSYPVLKDVAETSFSEPIIQNGMANLKGTVTDSRGGVTAFNALLKQEADGWKVQGLELPDVNPVTSNAPSVSLIVVGAGRDDRGKLVNPGMPLPEGAPTFSANVEMVNHPAGAPVEVWIELNGNRTDPIAATIPDEGNFSMPVDIDISDAELPPNRYLFVVSLGENQQFSQPFEIK